jgi:hypothetical protein
MKTLHTPAPWQVDYSGNCHIGITDKNERTIAFCNLQNEDGDEDEANAKLIAAAPDLLEALQDIADGGCFDQGPNCLGFVNMEREQMMSFARSVIAKAKGE